MAVDNLLGPSPLTITRQIVDQTNQQIQQVRETVEQVLLEGEDKADQSAARPQSQPVGSAEPSAEDGGLGQGASEDGEGAGGNPDTSPLGNLVDTKA